MQNVLPSTAIWAVPSSPVPDYVRNFITANYGVSPDANMYINYEEPNKVYVIYNGYLQYVDFASPSPCSPTVMNNLSGTSPTMFANQPVFTYAENFPAPPSGTPLPYTNPLIQVAPLKQQIIPVKPTEIPKPSLKSKVLRNRQIRLEKPTEPSQQFSEKPDNSQLYKKTLQIFSSEWHKLTDSEREAIQRERRKANAYKTALCQSFKDTGTCEYGDECCFAHGESELRLPPQAHPKYKTQLCNKFSVNGYCPYGSRCQFIHQRPSDVFAPKPNQLSTKKGSSNSTAASRNESKNITTLKNEKNINVKSNCIPGKTSNPVNLDSIARKKKSSFSVTTTRDAALNFSAWGVTDDSKEFTPDALQAQSTPLAKSVTSRRTALATPQSKKKADISTMLEKLFASETDVSFSQSCFPRLSISPGWLSGIKSK